MTIYRAVLGWLADEPKLGGGVQQDAPGSKAKGAACRTSAGPGRSRVGAAVQSTPTPLPHNGTASAPRFLALPSPMDSAMEHVKLESLGL